MNQTDFNGVRICGVADHLGDVSAKWPFVDLALFASGTINGVELADAIDLARKAWNEVCGIRMVMGTNPRTAHLVVGVERMDGPGNVLAENELPIGFSGPSNWRTLRGRYDSSERVVLADNPPAGKLDLGRICRHELGHFLGIGHISDGNLMAPVYSTTIALPQNGDVTEARARYGAPQPAAPSPAPVPPETPGASELARLTIGGVTYEWPARRVV